jgi:rod shape determining protein RodA
MHRFLTRYDPLVVIPIAYLLVVGLVVLRSIETTARIGLLFSFPTQLLAVALAIVSFLILRRSESFWRRVSWPLHAVTIIFLITVLLVGQEAGGATRWISLGSFQFQPSELLKLSVILLQARLLSRRGSTLNRPWPLMLSALYLIVPALLVIAQPDVGTTIILGLAWLTQLLVSPLPKRTLVLIVGLGLLAIPAAYPFLADYQQERIDSFFNPSLDTQAEGYNVLQATIAIGSGGVWGKGLDAGSQSQLNFLPAQHTDFIFAVIAEKLGFVGALSIIIAFGVLLIRLVFLAWSANRLFVRLYGFGVVAILGLQFTVNIAMNMGLLPVTGIPLPFVSAGGTHVIVEMAMVGILLGLVKQKSLT